MKAANPQFLAATATVDQAAIQPLPNSRKIYAKKLEPQVYETMARVSSHLAKHNYIDEAHAAPRPCAHARLTGPDGPQQRPRHDGRPGHFREDGPGMWHERHGQAHRRPRGPGRGGPANEQIGRAHV